MKKYMLIALPFFSFSALAQPPVKIIISPPVKIADKIITTKDKSKGTDKSSGTYKPNHNFQNFLPSLPEVRTSIGGTGIRTKFVSNGGVSDIKKMSPNEKPKDKGTTNDGQSICHSYSIKLSSESETFDAPLSEKMDNLYPGAIYNYYTWMKDNVSPQSIKSPRNPIIVQLASSSAGGQMKLVNNPTSNELQSASGVLKSSMPARAPNSTTEIYVNSIVDEATFALNIEAGGGGFGFSANGKFGIAKNSRKTYLSIDAKQKSYTIQANLPEDSVYGFFKDQTVNSNSENLIISSVTYGRRVIGVIETEFESEGQQIDFSLKASAMGFTGNFGLGILNGLIRGKTSVKLFFIGGGGGMIEIPDPTEQSVMDKINNWMRSANSTEMVPVSFTFRNMKNEGMRWETATDNINYQQCVPVPQKPKPIDQKVSVTLINISDSKREKVTLGVEQFVGINTQGNWKKESSGLSKPIICWMEGWNGCQVPPNINFNSGPHSINSTFTYMVSEAEYASNPEFVVHTKRLVMYRTSAGGSKNAVGDYKDDKYPVPDFKIRLKDIKGLLQVTVHIEGRIFTFSYRVSVEPQVTP
ncbi:MAG: thiol-activated cytolysin family protein [Ferruginibacter sp.]|nr:thiol-activated cytolysin family protein [Ferruginibacter sp.]